MQEAIIMMEITPSDLMYLVFACQHQQKQMCKPLYAKNSNCTLVCCKILNIPPGLQNFKYPAWIAPWLVTIFNLWLIQDILAHEQGVVLVTCITLISLIYFKMLQNCDILC